MHRIVKKKPIPEQNLGRITKQVLVGNDKVINVRRINYTDEQVEAVLRVMAHLNAVRDDMEVLYGTEFYSKQIDSLFDLFYKTKMKSVFKQNDPGKISDLVFNMTKVFSAMCKNSYELSLQPEQVQKRYDREMSDLLISCGVTLRDS